MKRRASAERLIPSTTAARRALRLAGLTAGVTGSYMGYMLQSLFLDDREREARRRSAHARAGRRMRDELAQLRGPAMKIGQALSLHGGLVPADMAAELASLQMSAPGMHPSLARAQFKGSMHRLPEEVFARFEAEPFAAASLGQVHRAVMPDGRAVAVKIQYPGIRTAIENDFRWIRSISLPASASGHLPKAVIDEIESQIAAETDYTREASNIEFFAAALEPLPFVIVPNVYRTCSSNQVLTMSVVDGEHLEKFLATPRPQALRDRIGTRLVELFYFQVLKLGILHADPHWGNYFFHDDGTIGLVDFGCVKALGSDFVKSRRKSMLYPGRTDSAEFHAIVEEQFGDGAHRLSPAMRRAIIDFAERFYRKVYPPDAKPTDPPFDFADGSFLRSYMLASADLARARGARPQHVFLARAEIGLYATLHRLKARVRTSAVLRRWLEATA